MERTVKRSVAVLVSLIALFTFAASAYASGYYVHDPMDNPKAAADIVVDPNAVYGYAPNPDSPRLGVFAEKDWSDESYVAQMRKEREAYHESIRELYLIKADLEAAGKSVEEIARTVSNRRNEMRMESYKDDPEGLAELKESNLETYGNENGGTPEYFYEKYGSWEEVIEKAFSTNPGADAMLGLYDKYYDTYCIAGGSGQTVTEAATEPESASQSTQEVTEPESASQNTQEVTEPTAARQIENVSEHSLKATGDQSMTSPKTGDTVIVLMMIMVTATGLALMCIIIIVSPRKSRP